MLERPLYTCFRVQFTRAVASEYTGASATVAGTVALESYTVADAAGGTVPTVESVVPFAQLLVLLLVQLL